MQILTTCCIFANRAAAVFNMQLVLSRVRYCALFAERGEATDLKICLVSHPPVRLRENAPAASSCSAGPDKCGLLHLRIADVIWSTQLSDVRTTLGRGAAAARPSHKRQVAEDGALAEQCDKSKIGDTAKGDQQRRQVGSRDVISTTRICPDSDQIPHRAEMTRCANNGLSHFVDVM